MTDEIELDFTTISFNKHDHLTTFTPSQSTLEWIVQDDQGGWQTVELDGQCTQTNISIDATYYDDKINAVWS